MEKTALPPVQNLFLVVPDSEIKSFMEDTLGFAARHPEILRSVDDDLDRHAREKKLTRLKDKVWLASKSPALEGIGAEGVGAPETADGLRLQGGRPRMTAETVLLFLMLGGYFGSTTDSRATAAMLDSIALRSYLDWKGIEMPGRSTIHENTTAVSNATRELILDKQMDMVIRDELDNCVEAVFDSTAVCAGVPWPTDSSVLCALVASSARRVACVAKLGLPAIPWGNLERWLGELKSLDFKIAMSKGKGSPGKRKKLYRRLFRRAGKAMDSLEKGLASRILPAFERLDIPPSRKERIGGILDTAKGDLERGRKVLAHASDRVLRGGKTAAREKVFSVSDPDAYFIQKGDRFPVIGYKPQIAMTGKYFVSVLRVSSGNPADSAEFTPVLDAHIRRIGAAPSRLSVDDGYTSADNEETAKKREVGTISFGGSKGKELLGEDVWDTPEMSEARNARSAVESLIFTLKHTHHFGQLRRRGLEAVRAELLAKCLAHNLLRARVLTDRKALEAAQAETAPRKCA